MRIKKENYQDIQYTLTCGRSNVAAVCIRVRVRVIVGLRIVCIHHIFFSIFHKIFLEKFFSPLFTRIFSRKYFLEKIPVNFSSRFLTRSLEFFRLFLCTFLSTVPKMSDFRRLQAQNHPKSHDYAFQICIFFFERIGAAGIFSRKKCYRNFLEKSNATGIFSRKIS